MVSKYFARRPPPNPGDGVKRSEFNSSEYGHVAYFLMEMTFAATW